MASNNNEFTIKQYEFALSRIDYQNELFWNTYNTFLAETVLVGFLGTILSQGAGNALTAKLVIGGSIVGAILCLLWWANFQQNYAYYKMSFLQVKRYESALGIKIVSEGDQLSKGDALEIAGEKIQIHPIAQRIPPHHATQFLIALFFVAFVALVIVAI